MTRFFEVASVSATHIYRSALELSPPSSIVRRLYPRQHNTSSPRIAIGVPSSWSQSVPIPNKDRPYGSCAWSPCGRFIAAQTQNIVEVRDPLTSELVSSFRHINHTPRLVGPLAYSSDGRSLCCGSDTSIVIWDIQTGGMVREVAYNDTLDTPSSLVWSLDGRTIGAVLRGDQAWAAVVYDVTSGGILSRGTLDSADEPYLWAHDKTFRVMVVPRESGSEPQSIDILEVWPTLALVRSFPLSLELSHQQSFSVKSFSPISHHLSISVTGKNQRLLVLDVHYPRWSLLDEEGFSSIHCFSSDGKFFAAFLRGGVHVWMYTGNPRMDIYNFASYVPWRELPDQGWYPNNPRSQFSPASSSILGHFGGILQVWYLDDHSARGTDGGPYVLIPPHATYIVTARPRGTIVTITNHISQPHPQLINTGTIILGFALTGNVLLVAGSNTIVAWRIAESGAVNGVFDNRTAGLGDRIWAISQNLGPAPPFSIIAPAGSIALDETLIYIYHSGTTEGSEHIPELSQPLGLDLWYSLEVTSRGQYYFRCRGLGQLDRKSVV